MYGDILVATDGSDIAATAVDQGLDVARAVGATVHVVSVVERTDTDGERVDKSRHQEIVERVEADAVDEGLSVVTSVRTGRPSRELLAYADEHDIALSVLGTHGRTGVRRWLMGSVATAVVREARCPVLTVNAAVSTSSGDIDNVLIATDGRPGAEAAIEEGLDLAETYGATVHSMYVVNDVHSHMDVVLEAFEELGERSTSTIAERGAKRGLDTERAIERGVPHREIVSYAADHDIDLIVVGTESRAGLDRVVAGSVSQRVISAASVPVLSVRTLER
ncbi:universal stress protein [Halopiger aswanensis]|uniref:Nucleotide-binding universal stress UspA family protein n=1 Tax=Halopiger aswanensis TaxID=148449 RepID=A0A3R7HGB0_9EURY|nr:universal stress protein [Halopiger aswanensis]RKD89009.1 nucleotide-binding universal stress UspA family protein [Halopiger aswanensis]